MTSDKEPRTQRRRAVSSGKRSRGVTDGLGVPTVKAVQATDAAPTDTILPRLRLAVDTLINVAYDLADEAQRTDSARFASASTDMAQVFKHVYRAYMTLTGRNVFDDIAGADEEGTAPE